MGVLSVNLPVPPSANALYIATRAGKRFPAPAYKAWKKVAAEAIIDAWTAHGEPTFNNGYQLIIRVGVDHRRDIGNCEKAITDALVANLSPALPDDRWCDRIEISRDGAPGRAYVTICDIPTERVGEAISFADAANRVLSRLSLKIEDAA